MYLPGNVQVAPKDKLDPVIRRIFLLLGRCPRGARSRDILCAIDLQPSSWPGIRQALENSGKVNVVGHGPGTRYILDPERDESVPFGVHARFIADETTQVLIGLGQGYGVFHSGHAQEITSLTTREVRRYLQKMVGIGILTRSGRGRSTQYHWSESGWANIKG
jgi:hypothetical protein